MEWKLSMLSEEWVVENGRVAKRVIALSIWIQSVGKWGIFGFALTISMQIPICYKSQIPWHKIDRQSSKYINKSLHMRGDIEHTHTHIHSLNKREKTTTFEIKVLMPGINNVLSFTAFKILHAPEHFHGIMKRRIRRFFTPTKCFHFSPQLMNQLFGKTFVVLTFLPYFSFRHCRWCSAPARDLNLVVRKKALELLFVKKKFYFLLLNIL